MNAGFLIFRFFRLGPLALCLIAAAILGLGYYMQLGENDFNARKAAALAAGPPAAFDIAGFDRDRDVGSMDEVVVRAQPVLANAYRLTYTDNGSTDYAYMVPLVAANAKYDNIVMGVAFFSSKEFSFDDISQDMFSNGVSGFGNFGPIAEFNGEMRSLGRWQDLTDEAFADQGLTMASNAVVMWPYLDGREAAFAPADTTIFGFMSKIAGAIGLLALGKLVMRGRSKEEPVVEPAEVDAAPAPMAPAMALSNAPVAAKAAPLWKQRSGLVDENDYSLEPTAVEPTRVEVSRPKARGPVLPTPKPRQKLGVRKVLIGIVGGLFALGLVSTVTDLVMKTLPEPAADVATTQERAAQTLADAIVPEADPNRHWTDIDVTPIAEWFVSKGVLAISGDVSAMMTLGMIIGGLFVSMLLIRYFFVLRRAFQPRTSARFDSMGLN